MDTILTCLESAGRVTAVLTGSNMFADPDSTDTTKPESVGLVG